MRSQSVIERLTRDLLKSHRVLRPAVDVENLASRLGAEVRRHPNSDPDVSGALLRDGALVIIAVNSTHSTARQRFTIAHEIGHLTLHDEALSVDHHFGGVASQSQLRVSAFRDQVSALAADPNEIEANRFAAALLMPIDFLERSLRKARIPLKEQALKEFAAEYAVSTQAMQYRLMNLGVPLDVAGDH